MKRNQIKTWATVGLLTLATTLQAVTIKNDTPYNLRIQLFDAIDTSTDRGMAASVFKRFETMILATGYTLQPGSSYHVERPNLEKMRVKLAPGPYGGTVVIKHKMQVKHDFNPVRLNNDAGYHFTIVNKNVVFEQLSPLGHFAAWLGI